MARRSNRGHIVVRSRRRSIWLASALEVGNTNLSANTSILDQAITGAQIVTFGPGTITRTIGSLWVGSDQTVATENVPGALGMAVVSEEARAAGAASCPQPYANAQSDLFFQHLFWISQNVVGSDNTGVLGAGGIMRYDFDSRGQRKIEDGQAIVIMLENNSGAFGTVFNIAFRMLYKTS